MRVGSVVLGLACVLLVISANGMANSNCPITEDFSQGTGIWTEYDPNGKIELDYTTDQRLEFNNWIRYDPGYVATSYVISDFVFEFEIRITASGGNAKVIGPGFSDTLGTIDQITNGIHVLYYAGFPTTSLRLSINTRVNGATEWGAGGNPPQPNRINIGKNVTYYVRLEKSGSTLTLSVFSDQGRTTHIAGSPKTVTTSLSVTTFNYFYAVNGYTTSPVGNWEWTTGWIDNLKVCGGVVGNGPPVADAGPDQSVDAGDMVQLDGSGSFDPDGDPLTYTWSFLSKPCDSIAILPNPNSTNPTFLADKEGTYKLQLEVNDGRGGTDTDVAEVNAGGLVAYWKFDEGSGNTAYDCSGNGNDGSLHGATWVDGKVNKALSFDGSNDYVEVPNNDILNVSNLTIIAWIFPRHYAPGINHAGIVGKGGYDLRSGYETLLCHTTCRDSPPPPFEFGTNWDMLYSSSGIALGVWTHVAATHDGSVARIYINGSPDAESALAPIIPNSYNLYIGVRTPGDAFRAYFDGIIDEIRIYNRALPLSEVNPFFNLTVAKTGTGAGLVTSAPAGINCGGTCMASYVPDTQVTLAATPDADSIFADWSGCDSTTGNQCTVTMTSNRTVTATFNLNERTLTVNKAGTGTGTVTSDLPGINCGSDCDEAYAYDTSVTLRADPDVASVFVAWSGDCSGSEPTTTITLDENKTCTATFNCRPVVCDYDCEQTLHKPSSRNALILAPYSDTGFEGYSIALQDKLSENGWIPHYIGNDEEDVIKHLVDWLEENDYGLVHITTHGSFTVIPIATYQSKSARDIAFKKLADKYNNACTPGAVQASAGTLEGRYYIGISSEFIYHYWDGLENRPLVYLEGCYFGSEDAAEIREAFLCKGAGAFVGFDDLIRVCYEPPPACSGFRTARDVSEEFYNHVFGGYTVQQAADRRNTPPGHHGDCWLPIPCEKVYLQSYGNPENLILEDYTIAALDDLAASFNLPHGIESSLLSKLEATLTSLEKGNAKAAINKLNAFINEVEAQRGKKITEREADQLIDGANWIIESIDGAPVTPTQAWTSIAIEVFPNPVRDVNTATFRVMGEAADLVEVIKVQIFDLGGRLVYESEKTGISLDWHTTNRAGEYLANGIYLYKIYALIEGRWVESEIKKLAILR